jgi:hypothetical protein
MPRRAPPVRPSRARRAPLVLPSRARRAPFVRPSRCAAAALALLATLAGAGPAAPSAWPREVGGYFLSLRTDATNGPDGWSPSVSIYGEYGLTPRITLVAQASNDDEPWTATRAGTSIRFALSPLDATHRFAVSLGVSSPPTMLGMMTETRLEAAVHYGRGFDSRWGPGWATGTVKVLFAADDAQPLTDVYGLVGLRPREGWMTMLAASRFKDDGGTYYKLSPSIGYELRDELWLVPSVTQELNDDRSTSVGLSIWWSF